jgi:hypothetical protein
VDFERTSVYGYAQRPVTDSLLMVAGLSYDSLTYPRNFRAAPLSDREASVDQISPKAGAIWEIGHDSVVRAAYARSLGGASLESSVRLEPSQVAGFNQAFRSIIPESVGGANEGATFDSYGLSLEHRIPKTRTYLAATAQLSSSEVERSVGTFIFNPLGTATAGQTPERLEYRERAILLTANQLLGNEWAIATRYRLSKADLHSRFVDVIESPTIVNSYINGEFRQRQHLESTLHELGLAGIYNHSSGFFGQLQALWYLQHNSGYSATLSIKGDDFWQLNAFAGYRFPNRRAEILLGLLNITDTDYRLNPLTLYGELPRERTLAVKVRFEF